MLRPRVIALIALAAFATIPFGLPAASAHSQLVSTSPVDGAVLDSAPGLVSFTFDEPLLAGTDTISINDDQGNVIVSVDATVEGSTISAPWPVGTGPGDFQIAYRVVSDDGHPVTGAIMVTIAAASSQQSAQPSASAPAAVDTGAAADPPRGIAAGIVIAIAIGAFVLAAVACLTLWRGRGNY